MKIFIDKEGFKYGFEIIKEGVIQPDWVECIPKEDGTFYDDYNLDGTPNLDYVCNEQVPSMITMRQTRLYLLSSGLLDSVESFVQGNRAWQIEWEYANEVQRDNQLISALQQMLNLTDNDIDNMFIQAGKL